MTSPDQNKVSSAREQEPRSRSAYAIVAASRASSVAGMACLQLWLAATLGPSLYGVFMMSYSAAWLLSSIAIRGADSTTVKWVSASLTDRGVSDAARMVAVARQDAFFTALLLTSLMAAAGGLLAWRGDKEIGEALLIGSPLTTFVCLTRVYESTIRAIGRPLVGTVSSWLAPWMVLAILNLAPLLGGPKLSPASALLALSLGYGGVTIVLRVLVGRWAPDLFRPLITTTPDKLSAEARRQSIPFLLLAMAATVQAHGMILLTGALLTPTEAGRFGVAARLSALLLLGSEAATIIAGPRFAQSYSYGRTAETQSHTRDSTLFSVVVAFAGVCAIWLVGRDVLAVIGTTYEEAYLPMIILAVGALVNASCGLVGLLLNMTGHAWSTLQGMLVGAVVGLTGAAVLTPLMGLTGVCLGSAAGVIVWNVILAAVVRKQLGIVSHLGCLFIGDSEPSPQDSVSADTKRAA